MQNAFRAEDIATNSCHNDARIYELLTAIRLFYLQVQSDITVISSSVNSRETNENENGVSGCDNQKSSQIYNRSVARLCHIRKSGQQLAAVVGKVCKFEVWLPDGLDPNQIRIEVVPLTAERYTFVSAQFPNNSVAESLLFSNGGLNEETPNESEAFAKLKQDPISGRLSDLEEDGCLRNSQHKVDPAEMLPVGLICYEQPKCKGVEMKALSVERILEDGVLKVSFCPQFAIDHRIKVTFGDVDIKGSPVSVGVTPSLDVCSSSEEEEDLSRKRLTFSEAATMIVSKLRNSRIYRQLLEGVVAQTNAPASLFDVTAAVLRRTSKVKRTLAYRGGQLDNFINSDKTVVKRRKILRQMITRGGKEIVIEHRSMSFDEGPNGLELSDPISKESTSPFINNIVPETEKLSKDDNSYCKLPLQNLNGGFLLMEFCNQTHFLGNPQSEITQKISFQASNIGQAPENQIQFSGSNADASLDTYCANLKASVGNSTVVPIKPKERSLSDPWLLRKRFPMETDEKIYDGHRDMDTDSIPDKQVSVLLKRSKSLTEIEHKDKQTNVGSSYKMDLNLRTSLVSQLVTNILSRHTQDDVDCSIFDCERLKQTSEDSLNAATLYLKPESGNSDVHSVSCCKINHEINQQEIDSVGKISSENLPGSKDSISLRSRKSSFTRQNAILPLTNEVDMQCEIHFMSQNKVQGFPCDPDKINADVHCRGSNASNVSTLDFWSQVSYEEIKRETRWTKPIRQVQPQKQRVCSQETKQVKERKPNQKPTQFHSENACTKSMNNVHLLKHKSIKSFFGRMETISDKEQENKLVINSETSFSEWSNKAQQISNFEFLNGPEFVNGWQCELKEETLIKIPQVLSTESAPSGAQSNYAAIQPKNASSNDSESESPIQKRGHDREIDDEQPESWRQLESLDGFFAFLDSFDSESIEEPPRFLRNDSYKRAVAPQSIETKFLANKSLITPSNGFQELQPAVDRFRSPHDSEVQDDEMESYSTRVSCRSSGGQSLVWGENIYREVEDPDFSMYNTCTIFGPGLCEGHVGRRNYFQV